MPKNPSQAEKAIAQMRKKLLKRWSQQEVAAAEFWISSSAYHATDKARKPSTGTTIAFKAGREAPPEEK